MYLLPMDVWPGLRSSGWVVKFLWIRTWSEDLCVWGCIEYLVAHVGWRVWCVVYDAVLLRNLGVVICLC